MNEQTLDDKIYDEATEWFVLMRADDISEARAEGFVQWISQSPLHQAAYVETGGFWDGLPVLSEEKSAVISLSAHHAQKKAMGWQVIAASLAFLIISFTGFHYGNSLFMDRHSTEVGELADIILADGSHLMLNTNSEIRVDLQAHKRIVYLTRGEVFFDVRRDENRPFFVETSGGLVRVLGTKFNIRQTGNSSKVTVSEGAVGVVDYGHIGDEETALLLDATLTPDQSFTLGNDRIANVAMPVNSRTALAWRERKLIYNGESFQSVIADINRYYDGEIRIGDPALNNIKVVAILKIEDRAATIKALEATFDLTARPLSKKLIILYPHTP